MAFHLLDKSPFEVLYQISFGFKVSTQLVMACLKLTVETLEQCEIFLKLTIKTPERRQWRFGVCIVNFKHISHLVLVFLLLTLSR